MRVPARLAAMLAVLVIIFTGVAAAITVDVVGGNPDGPVIERALYDQLDARLDAAEAALAGARADLSAAAIVEEAAPPPPPPPSGADRYVALTGSDTNPGTAAAPWRTIQHALNTAAAGQVVEVAGGVYTQPLTTSRSGTAAAPITIREAAGATVVSEPGPGTGNRFALQFTGNAGWWKFEGIHFRNAVGTSTTNVFGSGTSHDVVLDGVEVSGSQRQGIYLDETTARYTVRNAFIHDNGGSGPNIQDHNLYLQGTGHLVENTHVARAPNGFNVQIGDFARSVVYRGGVNEGPAETAGVIAWGDTRDTLVEGVAFRGPYGYGLAIDSCCSLPAAGNNVARNNTGNFAGAFAARPGWTYAGNTVVP